MHVRNHRFARAAMALLLTVVSVSAAPHDTEIPASVAALRAKAAALRPLHEAKRPAKPGEWLDRHKETGQTFAQYTATNPNRPDRRRTTLYLQPLGHFDDAQQQLLTATAELLEPFFGLPVKTLKPIDLTIVPVSARRVHPSWGDHQILTRFVLELLKARRPDDAVAMLALTTSDLWPGAGWNFVFGEASLRERVGVWSLHRFGDPRRDAALCLRRTLKTATHETGHMLGIVHCTAYECGMNGSNHLPEADSQPLWFCPEDEMKTWWACRLDPATRYARLVHFASTHSLGEEARFWQRAQEAIQTHGPGG